MNNINKNKEKLHEEKLYKEDEGNAFYDYVIQPSDQRNNILNKLMLF